MNIYKQYLYKLRELALKEPYIILKDDIVPKLKHYIGILNDIAFEDGAYHTYYGEIKIIVNSFNLHWTDVMDEAIKEADKYSHCITLEELMTMADKTIFMHKVKQADFDGQFLPCNTPLEEQVYKTTLEKYKIFMKSLECMTEDLKNLDKQEKVDAFAKVHFPISLKRKNNVFVFTYNYISYEMTSFIDRIRISIEEIYNRLRNNVQIMQVQSDVNVSNLLTKLYEKNKEYLTLSRQEFRSSVELAEVQRSIDVIRVKIEDSKHAPMHRLQEEYKYWEDRRREFAQIETSMKTLQEAENRVLEQQKLFNSMKDSAIPAPKRTCWDNIELVFKKKLDEIAELKLNAAKALHTFFSVRGPDRIIYSNNIGTYYLDEFGHQCYVYDYGLSVVHVNCEGDFVDVNDKDEYFYDEMGRFVIGKDNPKQRLYQAAPCSSSYKIENDSFVKHTKDCGHSEKDRKQCKMLIKDPTAVILPQIAPVNIKGTLEPDIVKYLWDTFGHILPDVLNDVAETSPRNPIHNFAYKLLAHKYRRTKEDIKRKKQESDMYRSKIHRDRIEKAKASYQAWKDKQTCSRKSDQLDGTEEMFAYNHNLTQQNFVRSLENYDI